MSRRHWSRAGSRWAGVLVAISLWACDDKQADPARDGGPTEPSPNASILPAPLATGPELAAKPELDAGRVQTDSGAHDAGAAPPRSLREDQALTRDTPLRDLSGVALEGRFRWLDAPALPRVPETNVDGLGRARGKTEFDISVELATLGRMRAVLGSLAFALPQGTEIRAAAEYYGHLLVWPQAHAYAPLRPGMLRAVFGERRSDAVPLVLAKVEALGTGNVLGFPTERASLATATGKLELEQAQIAAAGDGGLLLCRMLVELVVAEPSSSACASELVPVRATFVWAGGGRLGFEVSRLAKKADLDSDDLMVPPEDVEFRPGELSGVAPSMLLTDSELAEFRSRPIARVDRLPTGAPKEGLFVANRSDAPRYVLVDEVPVAWLRPGAEQLILGLLAGKYSVSARDFLGAEPPLSKLVELPARYVIGDDATAKER